MTEQEGTAETMNVIDLAFTVAVLVVEEVKGDGLQWSDLPKIMSSAELQQKIAKLALGYSKLPGEIKDLSIQEGLELAQHAVSGAGRVLGAALNRAA